MFAEKWLTHQLRDETWIQGSVCESFDQIAAMNLKAKAAGTVSKLDVLESLDIEEVRKIAKNVNFQPPRP